MAFTREFLRNTAKESGVEIPKEFEDALISEHTKVRDAYTEGKVQEALKNKPDSPKVEDTEEYKNLKQEFEDYKTEQANKETKAAKVSAVTEIHKAAGLSGKLLDMAVKLYDLDSLELDENGKAKNHDDLVKAAKTEYADSITKGSGYTPPMGTGGKTGPKAHSLEEAVSAYYDEQ